MLGVASSLVDNSGRLGRHCIGCCYSYCYSVHQVRNNCTVVVIVFVYVPMANRRTSLAITVKRKLLLGLPCPAIPTHMSALSSNMVLFRSI